MAGEGWWQPCPIYCGFDGDWVGVIHVLRDEIVAVLRKEHWVACMPR